MNPNIPLRKKAVAWLLTMCLVVTLIPEIGYTAESYGKVTGSNEAVSEAASTSSEEDLEVTREDVIEKTETTTTYDIGGGENFRIQQ